MREYLCIVDMNYCLSFIMSYVELVGLYTCIDIILIVLIYIVSSYLIDEMRYSERKLLKSVILCSKCLTSDLLLLIDVVPRIGIVSMFRIFISLDGVNLGSQSSPDEVTHLQGRNLDEVWRCDQT